MAELAGHPRAARPVLRIANCSGFYGDRVSAAREMVEGGPIDVLTGDWLAELTMLLLGKAVLAGRPGYARTFLTQVEQVLPACLERGIKIVANAGGLDPAGCAAAVAEVARRAGLSPVVAHVEGDDLLARLPDLSLAGHRFANADTGETLAEAGVTPLTAHAYLGGLPIASALSAGADVVVTGRVTDAALVVGPGMWRFGWTGDDLDALAGAVVAGHVLECGCQATGGNYAFFNEVPDLARAGFPLAELAADGSAVVTKHPGTGGLVSVGTVTAQLLYEIGGPRYLNPDVTARFDTIRLDQVGPDRVGLSGVRGEPPPADLKVSLNYAGGYRNSMILAIEGRDIAAKAALAEQAIWARVNGGKAAFETADVELAGRRVDVRRALADNRSGRPRHDPRADRRRPGLDRPGPSPAGARRPTDLANLVGPVCPTRSFRPCPVLPGRPVGSRLGRPGRLEHPDQARSARTHRGRPVGRQGRQRQRRRLGPHGRRIRLAGRLPDGRAAGQPRAAGRRVPDRTTPAPQPAGAQLRGRRVARPRRRGEHQARPASQGARRGTPRRPGRHPRRPHPMTAKNPGRWR